MMVKALGVDPKNCVYLDDLGVNLKPAREMGMTTIKVLNASQAITELEAARDCRCDSRGSMVPFCYIQYAAACRFHRWRLWNTGSPLSRGRQLRNHLE